MKFNYEQKNLEVEAYGEVFTLPKKTTALLTAVQTAAAKITAEAAALSQVTAMLEGISAIIGREKCDRIFPSIQDADCDEVSAFWLALNGEYNKQAEEISEKYTLNRAGRRA